MKYVLVLARSENYAYGGVVMLELTRSKGS